MADTNERELAEQRYVELAHDYEKNPIGSRDWVIFWNGWRERSELKATPLPADAALIGKLRHQLAQATDEAARLRALSQPATVAQVPDDKSASAIKFLERCGYHYYDALAIGHNDWYLRGQPASERSVIVPAEPTPEMVMAFMKEFYKKEKSFDTAACYRAMLSAAPSAKGGEG